MNEARPHNPPLEPPPGGVIHVSNPNSAGGDGQQKGPESSKPSGMPSFKLWQELVLEVAAKSWLVQNLLGDSEVSVLFGPPGSAKSVLAQDLATHVAAGLPWFGRTTLQGAVLYIALERAEVVKRRAAALRIKHNFDIGLPFALMRGVLDFRQSSTATFVTEAVGQLHKVTGIKPVLIVIDTFNRALCGGDENSPKDVGSVIARIAEIQAETGAHVLLVHHQPQEGNARMRGHGALLAAADCTIHVEKDAEVRSATVMKANDAEENQSVVFQLESVTVAEQGGERTTAPVVTPVDGILAAKPPKKKKLPKSAMTALRALEYALHEVGRLAEASNHIPPNARVVTIDQWRKYAYMRGISDGEERAQQRAFQRAFETLIAEQRVGCWDVEVWKIS